jgi:hypothetical protein
MAALPIDVVWSVRDSCWYARGGPGRSGEWVKVSHGHPVAGATDAELLASVVPLFGRSVSLRRLGRRQRLPRGAARFSPAKWDVDE